MPDNIVQVEPGQLRAVAVVHSRAFPDSALTRLGLEAVRRYYEWQLHGPHDHQFIAVMDGENLLGFAVGGKSRGALAGFVNRNKLFLVGRIMLNPRLVFSVRGRRAVFSALKVIGRLGAQRKKRPAPKTETEGSFGILAIAVNPACQGKGIGRQLMEGSERSARGRQFKRMHLTVGVNNTQAIRFYEKLGWTKAGGSGDWSGFMEKRLL